MHADICTCEGVISNFGYLTQLLIILCFEKGLSLRLELIIKARKSQGFTYLLSSSSAEITDVYCSVQLSSWVRGIKFCFSCLYIKHFTPS